MHTAPPLSFGALLRRHRRAAGLTQDELAARAGLSLRAVSDLERGVKTRPHRATVALLAAALGLDGKARAAFEAARDHRALPYETPLAADPATPLQRHGPLLPFVGRTHEMRLLERYLAGDGPPMLLLAGEPGIGKSRLLHEAAGQAAGQGLSVVAGGCQRQGGQEPYAPFVQALERDLAGQSPAQARARLRGCAWLVRLLPELADVLDPLPAWRVAPEQERRLLFGAVARYLANVAGPAGLLLLLDDLQWAGRDALDLLTALLRTGPAAGAPLRILGAYRDTEVQAHDALAVTLADLAHARQATHHTLPPLAPDEAAALLHALLPEGAPVAPALQERVVQRTGGVPFFLVSCAQALCTETGESGLDEAVPWDVAQGIRQRVATLPPTAQQILSVAAVVGRSVPPPLLAQVLGYPDEEVLTALEMARRVRLVAEDDEVGYQFAHDLVWEVVEADLGTVRRTLWHRRVAETLEQAPGERPVAQIAYHYGRSAAQDKAVLYLEQAGDRATAQHAHGMAEGYYREVVERLEQLGRRSAATAVREKWGAALDAAAQYDAALTVLEQAASAYQATGDQDGMWRVLATLGHVYVHRGTPAEGVQRLQPLLDTLAHAATSPGAAALYEALAFLYSYSGHYGEELAAADHALALARAVGDERIVVAALFDRGAALTELGRRAEALPALEEASRLAEARGDLDTACEALNMAGCVQEDLGAFATAQRLTTRALALAEQRGDPTYIAYLTVRRGMSAFLAGDWAQARTDYTQALALCQQMGSSHASPYPLLDLGRLCLAEGAWEEAVGLLEESCAIATRSGDLTPVRWAQVELAEHDLLVGRPEVARARLEPLLDRPGLEEGQVIFLLPPLAQAHLELGDVATAAALVAQAVQRARAQPNQRALVNALRVQAVVLTRQGAWTAAERAVEEGLALARAMPYPHAEARLRHVGGLLWGTRGEVGQARGHLEVAQVLFRRLGAHPEATRVERDLAALLPVDGHAPAASC